MKTLTLTAYPVKQGDTTFYLTAIAAGNLVDEEYWRVDRWDAVTQEGYQREVNQAHSHRLARYLSKPYVEGVDNPSGDKGVVAARVTPVNTTNVLPGSIVINFRNKLEIKPLVGGAVEVILDKWPGYFIDGQHRIDGIREAIDGGADLVDYEFPVTLTNFSIEDEMIHFRNLNTTANRPPKGLNDAISHSLMAKYGRTPSTWGEIALNRTTGITMRIASDISSPWYGKIALGGIRKRSMHTTVQAQFSNSLRTLFISGRFSDPNENTKHIYDLIEDYWAAVAEVWPEAMNNMESSIIQRPGGMYPLNRLLERIFNNIKLNPTHEDFVALLQAIRTNVSLTGNGWQRGVGTLDQLRQGYSENRAHTIVADYLWSAVDEKTKNKISSTE